jgi:hypothetical protein
MPDSAQHSSPEGFVFFKHSQLASRQYVSQPQRASLTEFPGFLIPEHQRQSGVKGGHAPALRGVVPEKGLLTQALNGTKQPGLSAYQESPLTSGSNADRAPSRALPPVKLVHSTMWLDPRVRAELEREAKDRGIPFSQMGAIACRDWVRYEIHRQQTTLFEAKQRHIIREEIQRLKDSLIPFTIKTARASEETRIVMANVYKRLLKADGVTLKRFYEILDQIDTMADHNIKQRSPKFSRLVKEWEDPGTARHSAGKEEPN